MTLESPVTKRLEGRTAVFCRFPRLPPLHNVTQQHSTYLEKKGKIISILKPSKFPTEPSSYRPISLLYNHIKILERLIRNTITPHIPLSPTQHGFSALHSTTTLLATLTQNMHENLNIPKPAYRTLVATKDISKAFDTVSRKLLIQKKFNTNIDTKKWLATYLTGRHAYTLYNDKQPTKKNATQTESLNVPFSSPQCSVSTCTTSPYQHTLTLTY